jgi:hypothetical protein
VVRVFRSRTSDAVSYSPRAKEAAEVLRRVWR